jgi:subtilisin family serine protease
MDCAGHGTHVAGIVGASGKNEFNVTGVAPLATLYAYKVFGCEGGTSDDSQFASLFLPFGMLILTCR